MAKTREDKKQVVEKIVEKLQKSKSVCLTSQRGLTVKAATEFRKSCKSENVEYLTTKKTLFKLALSEAGIEGLDLSSYDGNFGVVFGFDDEVAPARLSYDFTKTNEGMQIHDGILEGAVIKHEMVMQLAKLPSKDELLAKLVGSMASPLSGMVRVLGGPTRGFVQVLNQIREQKEAA